MLDHFKSVCVVGLGYIGLPTASILATRGLQVTGVDIRAHVVDTINRGEIHIVEPDLDLVVKTAVSSGRLKASLQPVPADVFILAVPTPFKADHQPDLSCVEAATKSIAAHVRSGNLVILESTSPVGTTEMVADWLREARPDLQIPSWQPDGDHALTDQVFIAHCPERVLPGHIMRELIENDRVIGGLDQPSLERCKLLYESFVTGRVLATNSRTAEMCKLTENAFRDVNIAFANELSLICQRLKINVWELIRLANHHPRVKILQPGPGVGGHCIAVDPWFIVAAAPEEARLIRTAREVNDLKPHTVIEQVTSLAGKFKSPTIAALGLAFKPDVDDLRESPSVEIVHELANRSIGRIMAVEPHIQTLPKRLNGHPRMELAEAEAAINQADIVVMLVNHRAFNGIDRKLLRNKLLVDTRGVWQ